MHQTPVPAQSFSNMITPSSSQATFPPSSPQLLSPALSTGDGEIVRPKSLVKGRSKSRGRRVSFVLNDDHRPRSVDRPSTSENRGRRRHDSPVDELDAWVTENRSGQDTSDKQGSRPMKNEHASHRPQSSIRRVAASSMDEISKSTKRSQVVDDESSTPIESRGQQIERGRTPGPPNRQEVSETSALSKRGRSRSIVAADKPSRAKK
ncbi:hypothetical protein SERLA73DRAFT_183370 [Serpula lacrymans var. lacrymans S7.3]|uniref:Uncharacterized protein n=2 Tax=Serpula lacrymans var. lacrymans TaxID=341189 RepID=F8PZS0_SERL3|nr:uncharacterized protein SERLADRAFT_470461 [Serpula lacrymans var. lacrymans S7.9]EGN98392.1 hypothetical protein SERLA73DRAFT_183370 [Serpula lacrymans var. lacrymans S7.3]EGO23944.1 hypothetical protein SERLADRAFT_470461 [Serpula lacrymans var. lacrymans S7.9]